MKVTTRTIRNVRDASMLMLKHPITRLSFERAEELSIYVIKHAFIAEVGDGGAVIVLAVDPDDGMQITVFNRTNDMIFNRAIFADSPLGKKMKRELQKRGLL